MYNSELKIRFIRETNKSIKRAEYYQYVFNRIGSMEEKYSTDICCMSIEQLQDTLESLGVLKESSFYLYSSTIREYAKWCYGRCIPNANLNIMKIKDPGSSAIMKRMVANPKQLQDFLDSIFDSEMMETTDNIYRAYFWLAFCGIPEELIFDLKCRDVVGNGSYVYAKWHKYRVPKEGIESIRNCASLSSFLYINKNYLDKSGIRRDRVDGDSLLRGVRGSLRADSANGRIRRIVKKANDDGKTNLSPTYQTIWLSGKFFYVYQRENAGLDPDFSEMSEEYLSDKDCNGVRDRDKRLKITAKRYETEYNRWKSAFNL